jgi:hypothetical protein
MFNFKTRMEIYEEQQSRISSYKRLERRIESLENYLGIMYTQYTPATHEKIKKEK